MALLGVGRYADDCSVALFKLREFLLEGVKLGRAHEGEVFRVKEENDVFLSLKLAERESRYEFSSVDDCCGAEVGGCFSYEYGHGVCFWIGCFLGRSPMWLRAGIVVEKFFMR
jgi:hypothetical protein